MRRFAKFMKLLAATPFAVALITGCGGGGGGGGGGSSVLVDTIAPSVVYTTPVHNETNVGTNAKITVTFSEKMDPTTVKKGSAFQLIKTSTGTPVTINDADVEYNETSKIAKINISAPLDGSQEYTATVNTVVKDLAGNALTKSYTWKFTTAAGTDSNAPLLLSKAPGDGATDVGINTVVVMSFNKPMDVSTFSSASFMKLGLIPVPGKFTLIGQVVVFTPDLPFEKNSTYTATVDTSAKDLTGNALAAPVTWNFTTGMSTDAIAPKMQSVSPSDGATNVALNSPISIRFDEAIYPFLYGTIDGKVTKVEFDYTTNTVTMTPTEGLLANQPYTTTVVASDLGNNRSGLIKWSFQTVP